MLLDYAIHPTTRTLYHFPKRQADLSVPNTRRNPVFTVPGGGGPINPKGSAPFDKEPNVLSYAFQINPIADRVPVDTVRDSFLKNIDHGLPQTLAFVTDDGDHWFGTCVLVSTEHRQTAGSNASHTIDATWVMLTDYLLSPATPGTAVYGEYVKYGRNVRYGARAQKVPLTAATNWFQVDNASAGATAATTDPLITLTGPFGALNPQTYPIAIGCAQSKLGFYVYLALGATDTLLIDFASRRVLLNNAPAFGVIAKASPTQGAYISFLPDYRNDVACYLTPGSTPNGALNGQLALQWKPKRGM